MPPASQDLMNPPATDTLVPQASAESAAPRRRLIDHVDRWTLWVWRWYVSVPFGLFLLSMIAVACIYGTMFYAANKSLGDQAIPLAKAYVFNARWFLALLAFFFIQFVVSTWHVTKMSFGIWWKRDFSRSVDYIRAKDAPGRAAVAVAGGIDAVERTLRRRFTRVHRRGDRVFAHAGLSQRIGPTIIHIGIVIVLVAGLVRIIMDRNGLILSEGRFVGAEGEVVSQVFKPLLNDRQIGPGNLRSMAVPYKIKVLDFDEIKHPNSETPEYFSTLLEVTDPATGQVKVAKLDMNHSLNIGGLEYHQASYQILPPIETHRMDLDVRDARTGERIAVTDASPETRVQVANEDLFVEIDGEAPGSTWRLYTSARPNDPIETGTLLEAPQQGEFSVRAVQFYPDFFFTEEKGPHSRSNLPANPALRVALLRDGKPTGETMLFIDPQWAAFSPQPDPTFKVELADVRVRKNADGSEPDFASFDWTKPGEAGFMVRVTEKIGGNELGTLPVALGQTSEAVAFKTTPEAQTVPADARHTVTVLGRSPRFITVLTVVNEPIVPYYTLGVLLMALGAMMTFIGRYRALYGWWDETTRQFHFALVPRFGKAPDEKEFERLKAELAT